MIEIRLSRVGEIIGAEVPAGLAERAVEGVSTDSRQIEKGDLFFALKGENFDLILLDIWLPEMNGIEVLENVKNSEESTQVVMISGHGSIGTAVKATKLGAFDFLEKPLSLEKVVLTVKNALRHKKLEEENIQLRQRVKAKYHLIGKSAAMQKLKQEIDIAAPTDGRVLIYGEAGTELFFSGDQLVSFVKALQTNLIIEKPSPYTVVRELDALDEAGQFELNRVIQDKILVHEDKLNR